MAPGEISEEQVEACLAACRPTGKAFASIIARNVEAVLRWKWKIEDQAVFDAVAAEVMRRLKETL